MSFSAFLGNDRHLLPKTVNVLLFSPFARRWRGVAPGLAIAAAACLFWVTGSGQAEAGCTAPATTVDCTGDLSGGVLFAPAGPIQNLNVKNLTNPIQPPGGTSGVKIDASGAGGSGGGPAGDGDPGHGGGPLNVILDGSQPITVSGSQGSGVVVLSNGGTGGDGGSGALINAGDGGNGGAGGVVAVTTAGSITVLGAQSAGVLAQSNGGRGGDGGFNLFGPGSPGDGGHGSNGNTVTVNNTADITASGNSSSGIIATSVGGAGGNGGSCGFGCFGGGGGGPTGFGGNVNVTSIGAFKIQGPSNSYGIFAQSVGGQGGAGGSNFFIPGVVGWAADSQSGGKGGDVTVQVNGGSISTTGSSSSAIYAQSAGGGGGAGGSGLGLISVGGSGTSGGLGGAVKVSNSATLTATGDQSSGIYAQSIGGAGGAGADNILGVATFGGGGGAGNNAGTVEVHNHGDITVSGSGNFQDKGSATYAAGIFAQSVGGGGGDGGFSGVAVFSQGGAGSDGGNGNSVSVENTATIKALNGPGGVGGTAIFAQSLGGGGGNGGGSISLVALGGSGSGGGKGLDVAVNNSGELLTTSQESAGIFAQSVGGGGGNGAYAGGIASFGGKGGTGGDIGGLVTVNNNANITTGGSDSAGIYAQSIGGGGGHGGSAVGVGVWASFAMGGSGGAGGDGGDVCVNANGGACSNALATGSPTIKTAGDRSAGILAQSVGGGGGDGGWALSASVGLYGNVSIGVGGMGGKGGAGGDVSVGGAGHINTGGKFSDGIDAQSIGGGGGSGGFSIAGGASTGGALSVALGGNGGSGNVGKSVTVNTQESITTTGDQSVGIFGRSIGGGGGNGGFSVGVAGSPYLSIGLAFGGGGGDGGHAGDVRIDNIAADGIHTSGEQAAGILAQSIGGGGGNGGFSIAGTLAVSTGAGVSLGFGGAGGKGGYGGLLHVGSTGDITTEGMGSAGILAQSIGGGGGNGGFSGAIALSGGAAFANALGGPGGSCDPNGNPADCNHGGPVDVTSTGKITTTKDNSVGILAQSIGGGGGNGGFSLSLAATLDLNAVGQAKSGDGGTGGFADKVTVTSNGAIETHGALSYGIQAQSIGGGGGNGGFAIGAALSESASAKGDVVGGHGGDGNNASDVTVTTNPNPDPTKPSSITTTGRGAIGILAQSVGGGGGNGGFAISFTGSLGSGDSAGDNSVGGDASSAQAGVAGNGSNAGIVTVNNNVGITTTGAGAHAILAQSIGGGGGNGGFAISAGLSEENNASSNSVGGKGGTGGTGGKVVVNNKGNIQVSGDSNANALMTDGIIAQSIGGGGGNGGFAVSAAFSLNGKGPNNALGGSGGNGGSSSEVDVFNSNSITVGSAANKGAHSDGILAQSVGGGGGNGGFAVGVGGSNKADSANDSVGGSGGGGGDGGVVNVTTFAGSKVETFGFMDRGIVAQSVGGGGGNGGFSISGDFSIDGKAQSTVGGSQPGPAANGAGGGKGRAVTVDNAGSVTAHGANSTGILAQSIGGGGGSGGFAVSAGFSLKNDAASTGVGGAGGNGGAGGKVKVTNESTGVITTEQANSTGISAQSIGGGGGAGGFTVAGAFSLDKKAMSNATGGQGGGGGASDEVDVFNYGVVNVGGANGLGAHSTGILAQSIGGGGGTGGFAIGASVNINDNAATSDAVGGAGGHGGDGGIVNVTTGAGSSVTTNGFMNFGIVAQSIGGGGGDGGFTVAGSFSTGGDAKASIGGDCNQDCKNNMTANGGGGGNAKAVTVDNAGLVDTKGANSMGIVAQSIGGGGGNGGFSGGAGITLGNGAAAGNSVGGAGGVGGEAGTVKVYNRAKGDIHTEQADSIGISAQSIGGGGGNGGLAVAGSLSADSTALSNAVGGSGGKGGMGGEVDVYNYNRVTADAAHSIGILAQSVGGGGGNGGFAIGAGVSAGSSKGATDSVGGSGGNGLGSGAGNGGNGGDAGKVSVYNYAGSLVETKGFMDFGIVAQSIGGGGGNGGFTLSGGFSSSGDISTHVGGSCDAACQTATGGTGSGSGGGGGKGLDVLVDNFGSVATHAAASVGIVAQSIGGGGGNAGFVGGLNVGGGATTTNAVGGSGGAGGDGGLVTVTNETTGDIHTFAENSVGVLAQSIGGGGGNGAIAFSASGSGGDGTTTSIGGVGGHGGAGGVVTVTNDGLITTEKALSTGIVAQSIGGGGGNGGLSVDGTLASGSGGSTSNVGGQGGDGGAGGSVTVKNTGSITIKGDQSVGILAQSIGGGGGSGGFAGALNLSSGSLANNVGGKGGKGGAGGDVTVTSTGSITTSGANSVAVIAQSIGGGGGAGGFAISASSSGSAPSADVSVGDFGVSFAAGGDGGAKGTVTVNISGGTLHTTGDLATAVLVQSIAGGGGIGGLAVGDPMTLGAGGSTIRVGAVNGLQGDALTPLSPQNSSRLIADLAGSMGLVVQSIGGGGGVGQVAGDYDLVGATLSALVGGAGANGGSGNKSTPTNTGDVFTFGDNGIGLLAQSIGGGGGVGNFSFGTLTGAAAGVILQAGGSQATAGAGAEASFTTSGILQTTGALAPGLVTQSIGGGGGVSGLVAHNGISVGPNGLKMSAGSTAGPGGGAGPATATINSGSIATFGLLSDGAVVQSIGGGGGLVGFVNGAAPDVALTGVTLGSSGGSGGASTTTVTSNAIVSTSTAGSIGLIAQSIGGGGGVAQAFGVSGAGPVTLGATGTASGNGGDVNVISQQTVSTSGAYAHAIVAQSIGGGGGLFQAFDSNGNPLSLQLQGGAGGGGNSGNVSVVSNAAIGTMGPGAHGVVAQSVAGGGGIVGGGVFATSLPITTTGFAGSAGGAGTAGTVTVNSQANIQTTGLNSTAVFAESIDKNGLGGNIAVTLGNAATGTTQTTLGGGGAGNGVAFVGGASNTLTNYSTLTTTSLINGMTITGALGNEAVTNWGHLIGSIDLGGGTNSIDNKPYLAVNMTHFAGVFDSGVTINLGGTAAGDLFTNEGLLSPGAFLRVLTTNENGNFLQTATGSCGTFGMPTTMCGYLGVDLDLKAQNADRLNVTGTASVSGAIVINVDNPGYALPGTNVVTLVHAEGGETHPNLVLQAQPTAVATYSLTYPNATDIDLSTSINFSPAGLTLNEHSVGNAVNAIQTARKSPNFVPIAAALFYQPTVAKLGAVYDSLSGEGVAAVEQTAFNANDQFHMSMWNQAASWLFDHERTDPNSQLFYKNPPLSYAASSKDSLVTKAVGLPPPPERTGRIWLTVTGAAWNYSGDPIVGSAPVKRDVGGGISGGLDYQVSPDILVGVAGGYGSFSVKVPDRATTDRVDASHVAAYTAMRNDNVYATAMLGFDYFSNKETRFAAIPGTVLPPLFGTPIPAIAGFAELDTGSFDSYSVSGLFEAGYRYHFGNGFELKPFVGVQFSDLRMSGFTETNSGGKSAIGLSFAPRTIDSVPAYIGAQLDGKTYLDGGYSLYSWIRAAWVHDFQPHRSIDPSFIAAPGFDFTIYGAQAPSDMARINTGVKLNLSERVSLNVAFNADLYRTPSYGGLAGVRIGW
jgi:hypothetical protein